MAKLYPPYIEGSLPAGYIDGDDWKIKFPYQMNRAVGPLQVRGVKILIKTTHKNEVVYPKGNDAGVLPIQQTKENGYYVELDVRKNDQINIGQYYKVQLAYVNQSGNIGYYSTVGIIKCIDKPEMTIAGMDKHGSNFYNGAFQGVYALNPKTADLSERVYSYNFTIYDEFGKVYATSGDRIHDNNADQLISQCVDFWTPEKLGEDSKFYFLQYKVVTLNGGEFETPRYRLQMQANIEMDPQIIIYPIPDFENGCVEVVLIGEPNVYTVEETKCTGTYTICRKEISKYRDNSWIEVHRFRINDDYPSAYVFRDFTVEQGVVYKYSIQQMNNYGVYSKRIVSAPAYADFEDMFLFDGKRALKVRFNPKVSSFKTTLQESKTDTIGHKYPYFFRNGAVEYKEFPVAGLLSYYVDDNELFIKDEKLGLQPDPGPRQNSLFWRNMPDSYPGYPVHEDHKRIPEVDYTKNDITYRKTKDILSGYKSYRDKVKNIKSYYTIENMALNPSLDLDNLYIQVRQANEIIQPVLTQYSEYFDGLWGYDYSLGAKLIHIDDLYYYDKDKYDLAWQSYQDLKNNPIDEEDIEEQCCGVITECCSTAEEVLLRIMAETAIPMEKYFKQVQEKVNSSAEINEKYSNYYKEYTSPTVWRDIWLKQRKKEAEARVRTRNLKGYNLFAERTFKLEVLDWLNNGRPKLFKSPGEGNYIVRLMNVSMTPEDALGRMLHNFTCQAYEMGDAHSQFDLLNCGLLHIKDYETESFRPSYHWRTEWLYKYYANEHTDEDYFEIEEYGIIAFEAHDFIPGDWFEIHKKGAGDSENDWEKIVIGATGNYIMQHELVPIDKIRLKYRNFVRTGHIDICYMEPTTSSFDLITAITGAPVATFQLPGENINIYQIEKYRRYNEWDYMKISMRPYIPVFMNSSGTKYYYPANYTEMSTSGRIKEYQADKMVLNGLVEFSSFEDLADDVGETWGIYSVRYLSSPGVIRYYYIWQPDDPRDEPDDSDTGPDKRASNGQFVKRYPEGPEHLKHDPETFMYDVRYSVNDSPGVLTDQVSYVEFHNLGRIDRLYIGNGLLLEGSCNNFKIEVKIDKDEETKEIWH